MGPDAGVQLNIQSLDFLRTLGVDEQLMLAAVVRHSLLASGINSPAPGTLWHEAQDPGLTIKTGPLANHNSCYNLGGYSADQCKRGGLKSSEIRRGKSPVLQALGTTRTAICDQTAAYLAKRYEIKKAANLALGLTALGKKRSKRPRNADTIARGPRYRPSTHRDPSIRKERSMINQKRARNN